MGEGRNRSQKCGRRRERAAGNGMVEHGGVDPEQPAAQVLRRRGNRLRLIRGLAISIIRTGIVEHPDMFHARPRYDGERRGHE